MSGDVDRSSRTIECVRRELKKWEWKFKEANGGRKPGREDVKNDAIISAKYEEYDRLSGRAVKERPAQKTGSDSEQKDVQRVLKERSTNVIAATPKKAQKNAILPDPVAEPEPEPTPACVRFALGPTPQKDGAVLGLFDMLSAGTPSKHTPAAFDTREAVVGGTPSKSTSLPITDPAVSTTPQSSAKRYYLEALGGTPLKRKREDDFFTPSTGKKQFATPAFLRRSRTMPSILEDEREGPPFKKRGLVRSLSAIIQGLRKQEDERMDDEWDVLNELEAEERGETRPASSMPKVLVEDSQGVEMPLGPDRGAESGEESDDDGGGIVDANGRPRKAWKKKGLKRQTRRVIMRPVLHKAQKAEDAAGSDGGGSQSEQVGETQLEGSRDTERTAKAPDGEYDLRDDKNETDDDEGVQQTKKDKHRNRKQQKSAKQAAQSEDRASVKKPKKVNEAAHANFRKLKIKNKNSKANGRGGRFGRR